MTISLTFEPHLNHREKRVLVFKQECRKTEKRRLLYSDPRKPYHLLFFRRSPFDNRIDDPSVHEYWLTHSLTFTCKFVLWEYDTALFPGRREERTVTVNHRHGGRYTRTDSNRTSDRSPYDWAERRRKDPRLSGSSRSPPTIHRGTETLRPSE